MAIDKDAKEISSSDIDKIRNASKTTLDIKIDRWERKIFERYMAGETKDDLKPEMDKIKELKEKRFIPELNLSRILLSGPSIAAALLGYDTMTTKDYTIILNRGVVKVEP